MIYWDFKVVSGTEIIDSVSDVHVTEYGEVKRTEQHPEISKKPDEGSGTGNDSDTDKNFPLQRKGGFRKSPSSSRKSSW